MFIIVLHQYHRESEDKWKRLSRQIIDLLLPMLAKQQVSIRLLHICLLFYHTQLKLYLSRDRSNAKVQVQIGPKLQCENLHIILHKPIQFCGGLGTGLVRTPCE